MKKLPSRTTNVEQRLTTAKALFDQGQFQQARTVLEKLLLSAPRHLDVLHFLGAVAFRLQEYQAAIDFIAKALIVKPDFAPAYLNLGLSLNELKRFTEAIAALDRAIEIKPDYAQAHWGRGCAKRGQNQMADAIASFGRAIKAKPDYYDAYLDAGNILKIMNPAAAVTAYSKAIELKPDRPVPYANCAAVLTFLHQFQAAVAHCDRAIELDPSNAGYYINRANALQKLRDIAGALASLDQALKLKPDYVVAHQNKVFMLLETGRYDEGWALYEWRWKSPENNKAPKFDQPLWLGAEPLHGKTILLRHEQGLGDTIQFCRYASLVAEKGARVVLQVQRPLRALLEGLAGVSEVIAGNDPLPAFDYQCPLLSLPLAFKTRVETIPSFPRYIQPDTTKVSLWKQRLGEPGNLRVGLVWSGGFRPDLPDHWAVNERRNMPFAQLSALNGRNIDFFSLQKGEPAESEWKKIVAAGWSGPAIIDHTNELKDFSDTAALIENLDLVISVDTATAHLAAAMGKTVWLLNRFDTCWRWFLDREDSPWYPSVRIYRQERMGDWQPMIERVRQDLLTLAGTRETADVTTLAHQNTEH